MDNESVPRREFVKRSATALGSLGAAGMGSVPLGEAGAQAAKPEGTTPPRRRYNGVYQGPEL
ncbi:MAG TPA: hypothetical protein VGQ73_09675, partial [Gemmatimonadales bacterium]|nr:hypothetical protein [Gemmatimonadales bacterium]